MHQVKPGLLLPLPGFQIGYCRLALWMCFPSACGEMNVKPWFLSLWEILLVVNPYQERVVEWSGSECGCVGAAPGTFWG